MQDDSIYDPIETQIDLPDLQKRDSSSPVKSSKGRKLDSMAMTPNDEDMHDFSYMAEAASLPQKEYFKGKKS